jgi:mannose-1-phosphate guanylyltransferase
MKDYYALILAGGGGTRLWPLSRKDKPKQMLHLVNEKTMFQMAVDRLAPIFPPDHIFIVTGATYVEEMANDTPHIPRENFIVEPFGRDNGPAVALALAVIAERHPNATLAMLTADHYIANEARFTDVLRAAYDVAQEGRIVTLGIKPSAPSTGFGYIQRGAWLGKSNGYDYHIATRFTEKPDIVKATQFLASGRYSWNSGMFIWTIQQGLEEFERQQPATYALMQTIRAHVGKPDFADVLAGLWGDMPKKSIDYAIMEGAKQMSVIPVDIGWSDVGTWASVFDVLEKDELGNTVKGKMAERWIPLDTYRTFVYSDRLIVTIGVQDIIVVETDDVLMICHRDRTQDVKDIVNYLSENGNAEYL